VPALIWPFSQNREQRLRAERLADRGLLTVLNDDDLRPDRLAAIIEQKLSRPIRPAVEIDLNGAVKTARYIQNWPKNPGGIADAS
jgi:predicted glycosyltransferase